MPGVRRRQRYPASAVPARSRLRIDSPIVDNEML